MLHKEQTENKYRPQTGKLRTSIMRADSKNIR